MTTITSRFAILFVSIVAFAFLTRLYRISQPTSFFFDEVYHGFTATTYLHNDPKGYEYWQTPPEGVAYEWTHPPLAKLFMALGMKVSGETSFGWRISSVIFGTGVVAMVGLLSQKLYGRENITILAMLLASLDGLLLSMSRIAMNDMHFLFFALCAIYCYVDVRKYFFDSSQPLKVIRLTALVSLFLGLALASKWTTLYIGAALAGDVIIKILLRGRFPLRKLLVAAMLGGLIVSGTYMASYIQFFLQGHTLKQWKETTQQMWWYHTGLKATHPYQSRPLQWVTNSRPVWMHVDYSQQDKGLLANIYNVGNPVLFWLGLVTALYLAIQAASLGVRQFAAFLANRPIRIPNRQLTWEQWFPLFLYGILWVPWQFSPRIMFFYHYAPAVPFLCIMSASVIVQGSEKNRFIKFLSVFLLSLLVAGYILLYPINTGMFMPASYAQTLFTLFPSWK